MATSVCRHVRLSAAASLTNLSVSGGLVASPAFPLALAPHVSVSVSILSGILGRFLGP